MNRRGASKHLVTSFFSDDFSYNINQNNLTESFNKLVQAWGLPFCHCIEWIRQNMIGNMESRRTRKWSEKVGQKDMKVLTESTEKCRSIQVMSLLKPLIGA